MPGPGPLCLSGLWGDEKSSVGCGVSKDQEAPGGAKAGLLQLFPDNTFMTALPSRKNLFYRGGR